MSDEKKPAVFVRRLKPGDLMLVGQMGWQQHYEARTVYSLEACLGLTGGFKIDNAGMLIPRLCDNQDFFMDVRNNLRTGDRINLCRYSQNLGWDHRSYEGHVIEVVEALRITHVDNLGVQIMAGSPIWKLDLPGEMGIVVSRGFAGKFVIRVDGDVYASRNTIVEANEYATLLGLEKGKPVKTLDPKNKRAA